MTVALIPFILPLLSHMQTPARDTQAVCTQLMVSDAYTVYIHIIIVLEVMEHTSV